MLTFVINIGFQMAITSFTVVLFYGSIASFIAGVLLLMSFASPYWLQSWEDTQSPLQNMGLWEFCFYKFRHPDYQFDHLFHGCHALYGDEYRLIREKLLPGKPLIQAIKAIVAFEFDLFRMAHGGPAICDTCPHRILSWTIDHGLPSSEMPPGMDSTI